MKYLVTGGAGFIGSNFVHHILDNRKQDEVIIYDLLTNNNSVENIQEINSKKKSSWFIQGDVCDLETLYSVIMKHKPDVIMHLAAEVGVDKSIENDADFVRTNIIGTQCLLDAVLSAKRELLKQAYNPKVIFASDNVIFGENTSEYDKIVADEGYTPINPKNPYAASKAAAEMLIKGHSNTHVETNNIFVARISTVYGPRQNPEFFPASAIMAALNDNTIEVSNSNSGERRDFLYVNDLILGLMALINSKASSGIFIYPHGDEYAKETVAAIILHGLKKPDKLIEIKPRKVGHVIARSVQRSHTTRNLGWSPLFDITTGITATLKWYQDKINEKAKAA